jgi:hypothetical protein
MIEINYLTLEELNAALPKSTAQKFKVVNMEKRTSTKIFSAIYGEIDFKTLTVAQAGMLVKKGANFLQEIVSKTPKTKEA